MSFFPVKHEVVKQEVKLGEASMGTSQSFAVSLKSVLSGGSNGCFA